MRIGGRAIGVEHPPYVIAEIGVNHDGSPARALELVREAASAGADAVKFQYFETDRLLSRAAKLAQYQANAGESDPVQMLRRLELGIDDLGQAVEEAHRLGLHAILTVFSRELVEAAEGVPWDAYKTASPDIVNKPLLMALGRTGKPVIISTGASELDEVERAVAWMQLGSDRLALLQCVSSYPTKAEHASIGGVACLAERFREESLAVGYSDHTLEIDSGALAVAHGAALLERHLTHSQRASGPDHQMSLEAGGLKEYCRRARSEWTGGRNRASVGSADAADERVGPVAKRVLPIEQEVRRLCRQSVVATRRLTPGERIGPGDVTIKRPGSGVPPFDIDRVLGEVVAQVVEADMPVEPKALAGHDSARRARRVPKSSAAA